MYKSNKLLTVIYTTKQVYLISMLLKKSGNICNNTWFDSRFIFRNMGNQYGYIDKNGTWQGSVRRVMDGVSGKTLHFAPE